MTPLTHRLARTFFLAAWMSLLFLVATNIQAGWLYVIIAFFAMLILVSLILPGRILRRVTVDFRAPELLERLAPAGVVVEIGNAGRFPLYFVQVRLVSDGFRMEPPHAAAAHIGGRKRATAAFGLTALRRGVQKPGFLLLRCGAPIGLYVAERRAALERAVYVHPRIIPGGEIMDRLDEEKLGAVMRGARRFQTDPFFHQLREGSPAEGTTSVHWKLTAKRDEPVVKLKEKRRLGTLTIVVDDVEEHYGGDLEAFESALEQAVSLALKLVRDEMPVVLRGIAAPPVLIESPGAWEEALRWSARIQPVPSASARSSGAHGVETAAAGEAIEFGPRG
ncbi:MAG: DUF58 domain-containing protein [bacterium]